MPTEVFDLTVCICGHMYVRSISRKSNWDCPSCGEADDIDNLLEVAGPERDLTDEEGSAFMSGGGMLG